MKYYLIEYVDGMTQLTHEIGMAVTTALNNGTAIIVAEEASLVDIVMELARLAMGA